ncbi:MAG TPA: phospholipase D-like domain-containing protein, partial [Gemmatimonadales bacterium]|nr:phospholipase D-like domain-containing protein [Gemmatimonadales bacterium]
ELSAERFVQSLELHTNSSLESGHRVDILRCGNELYPLLWEDLRSAQRSITLQLYYCKPGRMANELLEILCERATAGVRILFLQDAFGSASLPGSYNERLEQAGVTVQPFRPVRWYDIEKAYNRSHIRVVTIDTRIGYTGGFGLADYWWGDGLTDGQWRDTSVRFEGPAVSQLQAVFAAGWAEASGDLLTGDLFFAPPNGATDGGVRAGMVHAAPTIGSTIGERYLALSIAGATERLWITNAYFVPPDDFIALLTNAASRGVDVRILTAGDMSDVKTTTYAGRASYEKLLGKGVRIFEYLPTTVHAKTLVVDGCTASVGTMNFDNRSLAFNDETMLVMHGEAIGQRMEEIFLQDLKHSREIELAEFSRRPLHQKLLEKSAAAMTRVL